jgi:hypothetical protein
MPLGRTVIAAILLASLLGIAVGKSDAPQVLTEEDIVRMFVQGVNPDELIGKIDTSPGEYDLSDEMLDELRIAGIPEPILQAMLRRQAELHPDIAQPDIATESTAPRLIVRLNPEWEPSNDDPLPVLRTLDSVDAELAQTLNLRDASVPITDLGIALLCRTADHVPDHWRSKSPLGRDFARVPRHRTLLFLSGAEKNPASKFRNKMTKLIMAPGARDSIADLHVLSLVIPDHLDVELETGTAHDLTLGIALRIGERHYLTMADQRDGVVLGENGDTTLTAILRGGKKNPLKARVEFLKASE